MITSSVSATLTGEWIATEWRLIATDCDCDCCLRLLFLQLLREKYILIRRVKTVPHTKGGSLVQQAVVFFTAICFRAHKITTAVANIMTYF